MKICITGSSGHLGHALVKVLKSQGHDTVGIDILPYPTTDLVGCLSQRDFVREGIQNCEAIIHAATLHKPHVATHSMQQFIDTNITGTLNLLEESVLQKVRRFVFCSTTSTFGHALDPKNDSAVWVTEELVPIPKNIYGASKVAAEDLCQLFYQNHKLPCVVLKISRFFQEEDDQKHNIPEHSDKNIKAIEYLYRRADIADIVSAHILALQKAEEIGFGKCIISATTPFQPQDCLELYHDAPKVLERYYPDYLEIFAAKNWTMFRRLGRVYSNEQARNMLGWNPLYDFRYVLDKIQKGESFYSPLAQEIGNKGYHRKDG